MLLQNSHCMSLLTLQLRVCLLLFEYFRNYYLITKMITSPFNLYWSITAHYLPSVFSNHSLLNARWSNLPTAHAHRAKINTLLVQEPSSCLVWLQMLTKTI